MKTKDYIVMCPVCGHEEGLNGFIKREKIAQSWLNSDKSTTTCPACHSMLKTRGDGIVLVAALVVLIILFIIYFVWPNMMPVFGVSLAFVFLGYHVLEVRGIIKPELIAVQKTNTSKT